MLSGWASRSKMRQYMMAEAMWFVIFMASPSYSLPVGHTTPSYSPSPVTEITRKRFFPRTGPQYP